MTLQELQKRYEDQFLKPVPPKFRRNEDWIKEKLGESEAAKPTAKQDQERKPEGSVLDKVEASKVEYVDLSQLEEHEDYTWEVRKEKLYQIDEGKRFKCDVTGDVIGSGSAKATEAKKDNKRCYLLVKKGLNLTKHGFEK